RPPASPPPSRACPSGATSPCTWADGSPRPWSSHPCRWRAARPRPRECPGCCPRSRSPRGSPAQRTGGRAGYPEYHRGGRPLGIALAAQPANTSICTIEWGPGRPIVSDLRSGSDDDTLLGAIDGADKVAIDAPFGWPDEFVEAVSAHRNRAGWPG